MDTHDSLTAEAAEASTCVQTYLSYLQQQKSRSAMTLESYSKDFLQFGEFIVQYYHFHDKDSDLISGFENNLPTMDLYYSIVTETIAKNYVDHLKEKQFSESTINRKVTALRGFYNFLIEEQLIIENPFSSIHTSQEESTNLDYLNKDQLGRLFGAIDGDNWIHSRDRAIVAILYNTGMRVGELLKLIPDDIDETNSLIHIHTDCKASRECQLWSWVLETVRDYLIRREQRQKFESGHTRSLFINRDGGPLTARSVRRKLKRYSCCAELPIQVTPAILRHSCAMHMLLQGVSVKTVRSQLGHQSNSSIRPYLKVLEHIQSNQDLTAQIA